MYIAAEIPSMQVVSGLERSQFTVLNSLCEECGRRGLLCFGSAPLRWSMLRGSRVHASSPR